MAGGRPRRPQDRRPAPGTPLDPSWAEKAARLVGLAPAEAISSRLGERLEQCETCGEWRRLGPLVTAAGTLRWRACEACRVGRSEG